MGSEGKVVTKENAEELAKWCGGKIVIEHDAIIHTITNPAINVPVEDGVKRAHVGDIIIKKENGTFDVYST